MATPESLSTFVNACAIVTARGVSASHKLQGTAHLTRPQVDAEFTLNIAKRVIDSRKKVIEGVGKGIGRICSTYAN